MNIYNFNTCDTELRFELTALNPDVDFGGPSSYVTEFECKVLYLIDDGEEKVIGKLSGYRFPLHGCYWGFEEEKDFIHALALFDMIDDEVAKLMCLFNKNGRIKGKYLKKMPPKFCECYEGLPNIIFIQRISMLADYRGKKIGEALISNSIYIIGKSNDLVIVEPFPLQIFSKIENDEWDREMKYSDFGCDHKISRKKLNNYYKKLGFKALSSELIFLII